MSDGKSRFKMLNEIAMAKAFGEIEILAKGIFQSQDKKQELVKAKQQELARLIFTHLSFLRGTGVKLLQILSLDESLLPESYLKEFEKSYSEVHPLSPPLIKKLLTLELGTEPENIFESFDFRNPATASLGQVHRAVLKNGTAVAVKIQHPHVKQQIAEDMGFLGKVIAPLNQPLIRKTVEELSNQLLLETDYMNERKNLDFFFLENRDPNVRIPQSRSSVSGPKLLVMDDLEGTPLHKYAGPDQNVQLERIFQFFFFFALEKGFIYTDPHPGNFLILKDGRLGVIDFGAVKGPVSRAAMDLLKALLQEHSTREEILDHYRILGANIQDPDLFYEKVVRPFKDFSDAIFNKDQCDCAAHLPLLRASRKALMVQSYNPELKDFSAEFTMIHKSLQTLMLLLAKYEARISTRLPG